LPLSHSVANAFLFSAIQTALAEAALKGSHDPEPTADEE